MIISINMLDGVDAHRLLSFLLPLHLPLPCVLRARTWPDYDESADVYLVNGNELYVYPEQSDFFAVFTSEVYRAEDSMRYYFITFGPFTHEPVNQFLC